MPRRLDVSPWPTSALGWLVSLAGLLGATASIAEDVPTRAVDLVGSEAALVCEVRRPKEAWEEFRRGELFRRLEQNALYPRVRQSEPLRQWFELERVVQEATGAALSTHLLDLCSQEAVLAVYFSQANQPEGVLLTRADDAATVQRVLQAWQQLEPKASTHTLTHRGQSYVRRTHGGGRKSQLYYVTFGDVFALSDQEARIREVIDLRGGSGSAAADRPRRFRETAVYERTTPLAGSEPVARLILPTAAWERTLREAPESDAGAVFLQRIWPAIEALTVELTSNQGLHLKATLHLRGDLVDERWNAWSASPPTAEAFLATVPPDAVLAAAGGIAFSPLWSLAQELASPSDREEWRRPRKILQGLLGGRDLFDEILPPLCRDVGLYLVVRPGRHDDVPLDGVIICRFPEEKPFDLHVALDQGLAAGLAFLSLRLNEKHPDEDRATVRSETADDGVLRWLETSRPLRLACQVTPSQLALSRSIETLREYLAGGDGGSNFPRYRNKWFADTGQFVCLDARRWRASSAAAGERMAKANGDDVPRAFLSLCDVAFLAARFERERFTLWAGVIAEPSP
jgi:hypothetical protein